MSGSSPAKPEASELWSMHFLQGTSYSGLTLLVWEFLITFGDEINYVWTRPNKSLIKWLYLFSRYYGLVVQICTCITVTHLHSQNSFTTHTCRAWMLCKVILFQGLIISLEMILMIRVYALYNCSRRVGIFLLVIFTAEVTISVPFGIATVQVLEYNYACRPKRVSNKMLPLGYILPELFTHSTLILLTVTKHSLALRGWGRTPVVSLVIRDGALVFVVFSVLMAAAGNSATSHGGNPIPFAAFITILSSAGCRLILNMDNFAVSQTRRPTELSTVVLTSVAPESP